MTGFPTVVQTVQQPLAGNFSSASRVVGAAAVQLFPQLPATTGFLRISNVSPVGGPNLWISRYLGNVVAPNAPGAIEISPGEYEDFRIPNKIPTNAVWAVADGVGCAATVEFG